MSDFTKFMAVDVGANSTTVVAGPARLYGVYVNTALSAHDLPIQDFRSATSPQVTTTVVTIPASATAGSMYSFPGIEFNNALIVNPNDSATGNVTICYKPGTSGSLGISSD